MGMVKRSKQATKEGFSLVEVVMALGVISFAMVGILGLLSVGFNAAKKANTETRTAGMSSQLIAALRNSTLSAYSVATLKTASISAFFDDRGQLQMATTGSGTLMAVSNSSSLVQCQIQTKSVSSGLAPDGQYGVMTMTFSWPLKAAMPNRTQEVIYATISK